MGADQLHGYRTADLYLWLHIQKAGLLMTQLICSMALTSFFTEQTDLSCLQVINLNDRFSPTHLIYLAFVMCSYFMLLKHTVHILCI